MRRDDFGASMPGRLVEIDAEGHVAFEPAPLSPPIDWDAGLARLVEQAAGALRLLDGRAQSLENPYILIRPMLSKEAVASNRIEGTTATIGDVLRFEAAGGEREGSDDVREVLNYLEALDYGLHRPSERPLTWSYFNELHRLLLQSVRGAERQPGRIRQIQVVIGPPGLTARDRIDRARFIPPPPTSLPGLLQEFEAWLRHDDGNPALVRLALMHYQFETIHPYEDGNGRLGRLLITLLMKEWGLLSHPVLYLSEYFERHKPAYIDCLQSVSRQGEWRRWILFFLNAVKEQSQAAYQTVSRLLELHARWAQTYKSGRPIAHLLTVLDEFFARLYVSPGQVAGALGIQSTQVQRAIDRLAQDGIVQEITGKKRDRIYVAPLILAIINGESPDPDSV